MNKFSNMRTWSERMMNPASLGFGRPNNMQNNMQNMGGGMPPMTNLNKSMSNPPPPPQREDPPIFYIFNVPFSAKLAGPDVEDILHANRNAVMRWTHPVEAPNDVPIWDLPVHAQNLATLRRTCDALTTGPLPIDAQVTTTVSDKKEHTTTVQLSGSPDLVLKSRETILNDLPHSLQCTTIDIAGNLVCDMARGEIKHEVTEWLDFISAVTGVDIFLLGPKLTPIIEGISSEIEMRVDQRWRVAIYGDIDSIEHAKTRVLIEIDKMLGRYVDTVTLENHMHMIACGRNKKNIKLIESSTSTAIYFPPPHAQITRFLAPNAAPRNTDEVYITGENPGNISVAKQRLLHMANSTRVFLKDVHISSAKVDSILVNHVPKIRKILEANGTFLNWNPLASQRGSLRVQGSDSGLVDKTIKDIMSIAGQFYSATWWIQHMVPAQHANNMELRNTLGNICATSKAEIIYEKTTFTLYGFDDNVKLGLKLMSELPFFTTGQYQIKVKIELANEHKEFVSGKKNGKINKIMGQSNVQIMFDGFNEYNFNIDVNAGSYSQLKHGLDLVEAEMPASISFHVPDQYHKRIIGIGGQHIQRIMKKHSVFVKFSNAMDRGGLGREDDDVKVENVICRTPARNAQNLDLVKNEILDMVDQADSELTTQKVEVDRLYHRQLLTRLHEIEELEKTWNCKCNIPSSEHASDEIIVKGPEWHIPHFVDSLLGMVPDNHELVLPHSVELVKFLESATFTNDIKQKVKSQWEVALSVHHNPEERTEDDGPTVTILCTFTRNNAGAVRDAQDYLQSQFASANLDITFVKGCIPRPDSNTFSDSYPFFNSKVLQPVVNNPPESPARSTFGEEPQQNRSTNFAQFSRKLSSMSSLSSFLDRRKNSSQSTASLFRGSTNVSKTSLISIESTRSFNLERNPWNDSGVNLPDDDSGANNGGNIWAPRPFSNGSSSHAPDPTKLSVSNTHTNNVATPGDMTPRHNTRPSGDSGRPSTSHSANSGYPGPLSGPFR
ncbi:hypothetical protein MKZ38_005920 [Zalerion maritima]|uniref:K Homology domain-containing protein n=1 Tax=Zalerion maritima TaxID=339359 RepID=A0AAD5RK53_9PEZI|nr:hypothetical protein MKZ38_005920 [Zalerion maritima]